MRTAVTALLVALLLVMPFASSVALRNVALWTASALALAALFADPRLWRERRPPLRLWLPLACWGAWCVASVTWSVDPALSATELRPELFTPISAFVLFYVCTPDERTFDRWAWALALGLALLAAAAFAQHLAAGRWDVRRIHVDVGVYSTHAVAALVLVGYLWLRTSRAALRAALAATAAGTLVVLFWTDNRMTWPALAAMAVVAAVLSARGQPAAQRRRLALASLAAVALAGALFALAQQQRQEILAARGATADIDTDPRLRIWGEALHRSAASPWLGRGFGRGTLRQDPGDRHDGIQDPAQWHAHNVFLNVLLGLGVIGLGLFAWVWGAFARELARALGAAPPRRWIAIAGLTLLASLVLKNLTDDFFVRHVALLGWSLAGALLGVLHAPATPTSPASRP